MHCCDTGESPVIRYEHVNVHEVGMIDKLIAFFLERCKGNGSINLIVSNGKIQRFDPTSHIDNESEPAVKKKARGNAM